MENLFIPYELAVIAKEKGFNEPCFATFVKGEFIFFQDERKEHAANEYLNSIECSAPLYQQITGWFESNHDLIFVPNHRMNGDVKTYWYCVNKFEKSAAGIIHGAVGMISIGCHRSNNSALNKAIEEAFKLI